MVTLIKMFKKMFENIFGKLLGKNYSFTVNIVRFYILYYAISGGTLFIHIL